MKISKSLIQAIAIAVTVSTIVVSCTKDTAPDPKDSTVLQDGCPPCGRG